MARKRDLLEIIERLSRENEGLHKANRLLGDQLHANNNVLREELAEMKVCCATLETENKMMRGQMEREGQQLALYQEAERAQMEADARYAEQFQKMMAYTGPGGGNEG